MFADSLQETSWAHRSRRSLTTLTSFGLQAVVVGLLLMIPILSTVGLPTARTVSTPISLGQRDLGPAPPPQDIRSTSVPIVPFTGRIMAPTRVPSSVPRSGDEATPVPPGGDGDGIGVVGIPFGVNTGVALPIVGTHPVMPTAPAPAVRPFRTSSMLRGSLIHRVEPLYPPMARAARVQGPVLLAAVISKDGTIENLRTLSGHPLLIPAAISAVSQWRYQPYILNGEAIEVDTQITVNFVLGGN